MSCLLFSRLVAYLLLIFSCAHVFSSEENFILLNGVTNETAFELGPHVEEEITPCSTFKIALSLMGYDAGILQDENNPTWNYQKGYDDFLESWKAPQTPQSWMKYSCVWYSRVLAMQLGLDTCQNYLALLEYGNQDMSGGLTSAWLSSSLKISPKGQVVLINKMINRGVPLSNNAIQITKELLFIETLADGWKLFGKTGAGSLVDEEGKKLEVGWFVGWVEKDQRFYPFAYNIREEQINLGQRIPRVKQLLVEAMPR